MTPGPSNVKILDYGMVPSQNGDMYQWQLVEVNGKKMVVVYKEGTIVTRFNPDRNEKAVDIAQQIVDGDEWVKHAGLV